RRRGLNRGGGARRQKGADQRQKALQHTALLSERHGPANAILLAVETSPAAKKSQPAKSTRRDIVPGGRRPMKQSISSSAMGNVSENPEHLREFLSHTSFFGGLDSAVIDQVMALLKEHSYPAGSVVFAEGDCGKSMYLVRSGELIVQRCCPD